MKMVRYRTIAYEEEIPKNLRAFKDWEFSSGPTTGEDFNIFAREFKKYIKRHVPQGANLVNFSKGHYYLSGFIKRQDKFVYFSISDVRHFNGAWYKNILVRVAMSEKDYTGGTNGYTDLENFGSSIDRLLNS